ncbi:DNA-binding NarL/FixJ family response regulator [Hoyosella altamirensis]|uniref:DNA-binding NarL/FixJ family response regulator n=1 Tax=Hoyosella altamirensis TaxID=616997 RepID=A0A839RN32_9ACTN|nr:DNA-binding NarL/FixJ family response regulator [Hoyosella altamirensis]
MAAIRIVIADDHPVVRDGIRAMLCSQGDFDVVGEAANTEEALLVVARKQPDLLLTDLRMPGGGVELIREVRVRFPNTHIVVLSTFSSSDDVRSAIEAGAHGYLLKDLGRAELADGIRAVAAGQTRLAQAASASLIRAMQASHEGLAPREREILSMVADGLTNRQIARKLLISEATVKTHLQHLYSKLDVRDRASAVASGYKLGLLPGGSEAGDGI